jgi:tetratricopeptide (TPR) repeat protein
MDIIECYRLLQLTSAASQEEVKAAYRRLARQLHPDVNADHQAQEQFIRVTEAYKVLIKIAASRSVAVPLKTPTAQPTPQSSAPKVKISVQRPEPQPSQPKQAQPSSVHPSQTQPQSSPQPSASSVPSSPTPIAEPSLTNELSVAEQKLKLDTHRQLADLMKRRSLPRAIATVEALQARLPNDPEIRQWQALIYQRWGRQLIEERKLNQAKAYLKKALKTDPHNKSLWTEVEQDFKRIENTY